MTDITALIEAAAERGAAAALAANDVRRFAYTVPETAASLGTSPDTVRRLIKAGHLAVVPHMGARHLIPVAALEEFVSAGASTSAGTRPPAGVNGPSGSSTDAPSGGSVSPLRPPGPEGPDPTASPGVSGDAA